MLYQDHFESEGGRKRRRTEKGGLDAVTWACELRILGHGR